MSAEASVGMPGIEMVDLKNQFRAIEVEIREAMSQVIDTTSFINGQAVKDFEKNLSSYLQGTHVVGVGNGTDALQIAMMAAGVGPGDEVITTAFTFVATAEAAALLGAVPVFADIDPATFNISPDAIEALITPRTKAIVPVHLFGLPADMDPIMSIAERHGLCVIEDNAQGIGAKYKGRATGCIGHLGTLSFFPSKNLGCYGDGGAVTSRDAELIHRARLIANHGSERKYHNEVVGVNSRLDSLQAAILDVKLRRLDTYIESRQAAASRYAELLADVDEVETVSVSGPVEHVFHQYTIRVTGSSGTERDELAAYLKSQGIPSAVYYPVPLHQLPVFTEGRAACRQGPLPETEKAAREVLSLPMHTEMTEQQLSFISAQIAHYFSDKLSRELV